VDTGFPKRSCSNKYSGLEICRQAACRLADFAGEALLDGGPQTDRTRILPQCRARDSPLLRSDGLCRGFLRRHRYRKLNGVEESRAAT
jgi:hypothetical protein